MVTPHVSTASTASWIEPLRDEDRELVLRFAASFVWADCEIDPQERAFLEDLAAELGIPDADARVADLLARPPVLETLDPTKVAVAVANAVRHVALEAIAADGRVEDVEMRMFETLDDLLPRGPTI